LSYLFSLQKAFQVSGVSAPYHAFDQEGGPSSSSSSHTPITISNQLSWEDDDDESSNASTSYDQHHFASILDASYQQAGTGSSDSTPTMGNASALFGENGKKGKFSYSPVYLQNLMAQYYVNVSVYSPRILPCLNHKLTVPTSHFPFEFIPAQFELLEREGEEEEGGLTKSGQGNDAGQQSSPSYSGRQGNRSKMDKKRLFSKAMEGGEYEDEDDSDYELQPRKKKSSSSESHVNQSVSNKNQHIQISENIPILPVDMLLQIEEAKEGQDEKSTHQGNDAIMSTLFPSYFSEEKYGQVVNDRIKFTLSTSTNPFEEVGDLYEPKQVEKRDGKNEEEEEEVQVFEGNLMTESSSFFQERQEAWESKAIDEAMWQSMGEKALLDAHNEILHNFMRRYQQLKHHFIPPPLPPHPSTIKNKKKPPKKKKH
jgi:hypothetical protein